MHPFLRVHNGKFSSLDAFLNSKWLATSTPPRLGCSSWASASLLVCLRLGAEVAGRSGQTSLPGGGGASVSQGNRLLFLTVGRWGEPLSPPEGVPVRPDCPGVSSPPAFAAPSPAREEGPSAWLEEVVHDPRSLSSLSPQLPLAQ